MGAKRPEEPSGGETHQPGPREWRGEPVPDATPPPPPAPDSWTGPHIGGLPRAADTPTNPITETRRSEETAVVGELPRISGYEILSVLGRGGMAIVYRARQRNLDRAVALKMVGPGCHLDGQQITRFQLEAQAVAQLEHPNIVPIYEIGTFEGCPFFTTELLQGGTLADALHGEPQNPSTCAEMVRSIARAVHFTHQHGIVHRDLKPSNVLLTRDGIPKVCDFGLAKRTAVEKGLTRTGAVMGTPSYMAPEQAAGRSSNVGPAADIYALGGILYQMLTGRPPFLAETSVDTLMQVVHQDPVPPRRLNPNVPRDLETIALKCLRKQPAARYPSAAAVAQDVERFLHHQPIIARPVGMFERGWRWCHRRPLVASLLLAVVLTAVSGLAGVISQWRRAETEAVAAMQERDRAERSEAARRQSLYVTRINLAWQAWQNGQLTRMRYQLGQTVPSRASKGADLRGFEWYFLSRLSRSSGQQVLDEHRGPVRSVAFAPGDTVLATCGQDGTVTFWDPSNGTRRDHFSCPLPRAGKTTGDANDRSRSTNVATAYTANGRWLILASGRSLCVTDVATAKPNSYTFSCDAEILSIAVAHQANHLASSDRLGRVILRHLPDGSEMAALQTETGGLPQVPCLPLAFAPNDQDLLTASVSGTLVQWNVATGKTHTLPINQPATSIALSPDGKLLAVAAIGRQGEVLLWDTRARSVRAVLQGHTDQVNALAFSPDGETLATGSADQTVKLWHVATTRLLGTYKGHVGAVNSLVFSSSGERLATGSEDGTAMIWNTGPHREFETLTSPDDGTRIDDLCFTPDGNRLVASGYWLGDRREPLIRLWDGRADWQPVTLRGPPRGVVTLAVSPDGQTLVTGEARFGDLTSPGLFRLWNLETGRVRAVLRGHRAHVCSAQFSPDGRRLATSCGDLNNVRPGEVKIWRVASGELVSTLPRHQGAVLVAFTRGASELMTAAVDLLGKTQVRRWDPETGSQIAAVDGPFDHLTAWAATCDGSWLASSHVASDGQFPVKLWRLPEGELAAILTGAPSAVNWLCFSRDAKQLAAGGYDGSVTTWDVEKRVKLLQMPGDGDMMSMVAFSPNGKVLAGISVNPRTSPEERPSAMTCWNLESGKRIGQTRFPLSRALCLGFASQGSRLVTGTDQGGLVMWDSGTLRVARVLQREDVPSEKGRHRAEVTHVSISSDGRTLATGSQDGTLMLWDLRATQVIGTLPVGDGPVSCLGFSPSGHLLLVGTTARQTDGQAGGCIAAWDVANQRLQFEVPLHRETPFGLAVSTGRSSAVITAGGNALLSNRLLLIGMTGQIRSDFRCQRLAAGCVAISADGNKVAFPEDSFDIALWDAGRRQIERHFHGHENFVSSIVFAPDGKSLITGSQDQTLRIWQVATGEELLALPHPDGVDAVAISPDGRTLASASREHGRAIVRLWRAPRP